MVMEVLAQKLILNMEHPQVQEVDIWTDRQMMDRLDSIDRLKQTSSDW